MQHCSDYSHMLREVDANAGPISMADVVPRELGTPDPGKIRYGRPYTVKHKLISGVEKLKLDEPGMQLLERLPAELLYRVCDFLPTRDVKKVAVVSKSVSDIAIWAIYYRSTFIVMHSLYADMTNEAGRRWIHKALLRLPSLGAWKAVLTLSKLTKITIDFVKDSVHSKWNSAEVNNFITNLGSSIIPQLTELQLFGVGDLHRLNVILKKAVKLEELTLFTVCSKKGLLLGDVLTRTVGPRLKVLRLALYSAKKLRQIDHLRTLGDVIAWPELRLVQYGHAGPYVSMLSRAVPEFCPKAVHVMLWHAAERHGGWNLRLKESVNISHFAVLTANEIVGLLKHLEKTRPSTESQVVFNARDNWRYGILDISDDPFDARQRLIERRFSLVAMQTNGLSLTLTGWQAPSDEVYTTLKMNILHFHTVTIRMASALKPFHWAYRPWVAEDFPEQAASAFNSWEMYTKFLLILLPDMHTMHTLRIITTTTTPGGDICLKLLDRVLSTLNRNSFLRHLELNLAALTQPRTHIRNDVRDFTPAAHLNPHYIIKQVCWISLPALNEGRYDLRRTLPNLLSLSLNGLILRRDIEFIWFHNLTANLKSLERLRVADIVYHLDHFKADKNRVRPGNVEKRGEPERRAKDGTRKLARKTPLEDEEDESMSTDSGFGRDPRFMPEVDQGLRGKRMEKWLEEHFINTARRGGGVCRDASVTRMGVNATGLQPWFTVPEIDLEHLAEAPSPGRGY